MRIGINLLSVLPNRTGGGEIYLTHLVENIAKIDKKNEYYLFVSQKNRCLFEIKQPNFKQVLCKCLLHIPVLRIIYEQLLLPILIKKYRINVFHSPANIAPLFTSCKTVLTVQNLTNFQFPEVFSFLRRIGLNFLVKSSCRRAKKIIAISDYTKTGIVKYTGVPDTKIRKVYHGVNNIFRQLNKETILSRIEKILGFRDDYILSVATSHINKNLIGVIQSFKLAKEKMKGSVKLVLLGIKGYHYNKMLQEIKRQGLTNDVVVIDYFVDYREMPLLYNNAILLLFLTYGDSFGLPLVEAMACGTPVITSNVTAPPEIVGDAAIKVDPSNIEEITESIYRLTTDSRLREEMSRKGIKRSREFSWENTARETIKVFEDIHKNNF